MQIQYRVNYPQTPYNMEILELIIFQVKNSNLGPWESKMEFRDRLG